MSTSTRNTSSRRGLLLAGAIVFPLLVLVAYLVASRAPGRWFSPRSDYLALGLAVASGAICVWKLLPRSGWRFLMVGGYVLAGAVLLSIFTLGFVCAAFEDCL
jgi:hypothetical protein